VASQFVLLQIGSMRGVDLDLFDFDYDLTWMAFFVSADEKVYGRYGGRHPDGVHRYRSLAGLRHALEAALAAHRRDQPQPPRSAPQVARTPEQYPAAKRLSASSCIHCHHVHECRREALQAAGTWRAELEYIYPLPENLGLALDVDRGDRLRAVTKGSAAAGLGLAPGDILRTVNGAAVASFGDVQYALQRAPSDRAIALTWERAGKAQGGTLQPPPDWRKTDISWRWSLRSLQPDPSVHGEDLTAAEKKALGLESRQLALRQGPFVTAPARFAGLQTGDVIIGVDGHRLEMTARQFDTYVRLNYRPGAEVILNVLRSSKRLDLTLKLPQ